MVLGSIAIEPRRETGERFLVALVSMPPYQGKFTREIVEGEIKRNGSRLQKLWRDAA